MAEKRESKKGRMVSEEKLLAYVQILESTNVQLVFALKKCLEVLSVGQPFGDRNKWEEMLKDFQKIASVGEQLVEQKPRHDSETG